MTEHEVCKGCRWNDYPNCLGTKMFDGVFMNIEKLKSGFQCGQKESLTMVDISFKPKLVLELKIEELEARISELEK